MRPTKLQTALAALLCCMKITTAQAAIFGDDDRREAPLHRSPYSAVVKVVGGRNAAGDELYCTGVLVHPRIVVTAAHCALGRVPSVYFGLRPSSSDGRIRGLDASLGRSVDDENDWAIIVLWEEADPTIRPISLWEGPAPSSGQSVLAVSYAGDIIRDDSHGETLMEEQCRIRGTRGRVILHDCDTAPEASGAPLLAQGRDGQWRLAALHFAESRRPGSRLSPHEPARYETYSNSLGNRALGTGEFRRELQRIIDDL